MNLKALNAGHGKSRADHSSLENQTCLFVLPIATQLLLVRVVGNGLKDSLAFTDAVFESRLLLLLRLCAEQLDLLEVLPYDRLLNELAVAIVRSIKVAAFGKLHQEFFCAVDLLFQIVHPRIMEVRSESLI